MDELLKIDLILFVEIKHIDDAVDQWVHRKFGDFEQVIEVNNSLVVSVESLEPIEEIYDFLSFDWKEENN